MSGFSANDPAVARFAGRRRLVTTDRLRACGLGKDAIAYPVASGRFRFGTTFVGFAAPTITGEIKRHVRHARS